METLVSSIQSWRESPDQNSLITELFSAWTPAALASGVSSLEFHAQIAASLSHAPGLADAAVRVITSDSEVNGVLSMSCLTQLFNHHGAALGDRVVPCIALIESLFKNMQSMVGDGPNTQAMFSFRVLVQSPRLLTQMAKSGWTAQVQDRLPVVLPHLNKGLRTNVRPGAANSNQICGLQVQILAFLSSLLKGPLQDMVAPLHEILCTSVRQLLLATTSDRRLVLESLLAIAESDARRFIFRQLDTFLDTDILLGRGIDPSLSDLVQFADEVLSEIVRQAAADHELHSLEQVARITHNYCLNVLDISLDVGAQTRSMQVILALVENIYRLSSSDKVEIASEVDEERRSRGRYLLVRILQTIVMKFEAIAISVPAVVASGKINNIDLLINLMQVMVRDLQMLLWRIANVSGALGSKGGWMFKNEECRLISRFLHATVECLYLFDVGARNGATPVPGNIECSTDGVIPNAVASASSTRSSAFLEKFANVFVSLDPASFRRIIGVDIGILFEAMVRYDSFPRLVIPQQFLGNPSVSKIFADIIMLFLLERLNDMAAPSRSELPIEVSPEDLNKSSVALLLLNMFRIVAGSLLLYADNEEALHPYISRLVRKSIRLALNVRYKVHYLWMLRHLFRSIGGGKFQRLYQAFAPLLPELLSGLSCLQDQEFLDPGIRELAVELSLTVPARLSTLLTLIPLMMKSVIRALESADEQIVKVGLRTFEFWVDKLNHDYLFDHLSADISKAMRALCALLKPSPATFGASALMLLGKLGGRNRRFLIEPHALPFKVNVHESLPVSVNLLDCSGALPLSSLVEFAVKYLRQNCRNLSATAFGDNAFFLIKACFALIFDVDACSQSLPLETLQAEGCLPSHYQHSDRADDPGSTFGNGPSSLASSDIADSNHSENAFSSSTSSDPDTGSEQNMVLVDRGRSRLNALKSTARSLICGVVYVAASPGNQDAHLFLSNLARFFALLWSIPHTDPFGEDRLVFIDALISVSSSKEAILQPRVLETSTYALSTFLDELILLFGAQVAHSSPAIRFLLQKLILTCHERTPVSRRAGAIGLDILCRQLPPEWTKKHAVMMIHALIATLGEDVASFSQTRWFDPDVEADESFDTFQGDDSDPDTINSQCQATIDVITSATQTLIFIIETVLGSGDTSANSVSASSLVEELSSHLSDASWSCRTGSLQLIERIATHQGLTVAAILDGYLANLAEPVLQRTLAKVAPSMRVGRVWAASLALRINPALAPPEQLGALVGEAIETLKTGRSTRGKNRDIARLHVEYISLMAVIVSSTTLAWNDDLRNAVVQSLFNSLVDRSSGVRIVSAAKRGLAVLCRHHKLPKTLLRNCLEPVLRNLADSSTLSMPLLVLLEHLLQLLSHCFNVTLGRTLLDHLFFFSEAIKQMLTVPGPVSLPALRQPGDEIRLPCKLLDLFHRLPPAPRQFLTKLVMAVVSLENMLPLLRVFGGHGVLQPSPFRAPLMRFVCKYAAESVAFFLTPKNLVDRRLSTLFLEILSSSDGAPVCDTLIYLSDQLLAASFNIEQSQQTQSQQMQIHKRQQRELRLQEGIFPDAMDIVEDIESDVVPVSDSGIALDAGSDGEVVQRRSIPEKAVEELELQGVNIVHQLVQYQPSFLGQAEAARVVQAIFQSWGSQAQMVIDPDTPMEKITKRMRLAQCLISYWKAKIDSGSPTFSMSVIWMLLPTLGSRSLVDFSFLDRFISEEIATELPSSKFHLIARELISSILPSSSSFSDAERKAGLRSLLIPAIEKRDERSVRTVFQSLMPKLCEVGLDQGHSPIVRLLFMRCFSAIFVKASDLIKESVIPQIVVFSQNHIRLNTPGQHLPMAVSTNALQLLSLSWVSSPNVDRKTTMSLFIRCFRAAVHFNSEPARLALIHMVNSLKSNWNSMLPGTSGHVSDVDSLLPFSPDISYDNDEQYLDIVWTKRSVPDWIQFLANVVSRSQNHAIQVYRLILEMSDVFAAFANNLADAICQSLALTSDLSQCCLILDIVDLLVSWNVVSEVVGEVSTPSAKRLKTRASRASSRSVSPRKLHSIASWSANLISSQIIVDVCLRLFQSALGNSALFNEPLHQRLFATTTSVLLEWPNTSLDRLNSIIMAQVTSLDVNALCFAVNFLESVLSVRKHSFFTESASRPSVIDAVIRRVFEFPESSAVILEPFLILLRRLQSFVPILDTPELMASLYSSMHTCIQAGIQQKDVFVLHMALATLEVASQESPMYMATLNSSLSQVVHTLTRRCLMPGLNRGVAFSSPSKPGVSSSGGIFDTVALLCAIRLVAARSPHLKEQRKQVLSSISNLVDKSDDVNVLSAVASVACSWILSPSTAIPDLNLKEKISLLVKLSRIEDFMFSAEPGARNREVLNLIFTAVLEFLGSYEESTVASPALRIEIFKGLSKPILSCLRSAPAILRSRMIKIIHNYAGTTIASRLQFLLEGSGWSSVHERFWLGAGNELLLSVLFGDQRARVSPDCARISVGSLQGYPATKCSVDQKIALSKHSVFIAALQSVSSLDLIKIISELVSVDDNFARLCWEAVFPLAWSTLSSSDHNAISATFARLLPRDDLLKQLRMRPNIVHSLLSSFQRCDRPPELRPELISYLGRTFGAWHSASRLLDRLVLNPAGSLSAGEDALHVRAVLELYDDMNERDVFAGIVHVKHASAFTKAGLALEQYGLWPRAQEEFYNGMRSIHEPFPWPDAVEPCADESNLWGLEWIRSSRYLHQWTQLGEMSSHIHRPDLIMEAAALAGDGRALESLIDTYGTDSHPALPIRGILFRLHVLLYQQAQLVLHLKNEEPVVVLDSAGAPVPHPVLLQRITIKHNSSLDRAIDISLQEWSRRPDLIGSGHIELLSRFQQLVEFRECRVILEEAGKAWKLNRIPDFKNIIALWRDRLPNFWDSICLWNEIICNRMHMFDRLLIAFRGLSSSPPDASPGSDIINLADPTWTTIKMAETARRQQLPQVCLTWLSRLFPVAPNMLSPADAFSKLREQVRICMQTSDEIRSAVSLLNLSPMDRFSPEQCAELFRLKGEALEHLGLGEESHTAFSSSLAICDDYGKGWLSWGAFCDQLFGLQKDRQWAEYTVSCYLQAVRFHSSDKARLTLARVLWLMSYDKNDGPLNTVFKKYSADLPVWVWLLWLPQLIASLPRQEGTAFTSILQNVARAFPQSLYYGIRAYLHERRDTQRIQQQTSAARVAVAHPDSGDSIESGMISTPIMPTTPIISVMPAQIGTPDTDMSSEQRAASERCSANVRAVVTALRTQHLNLVAELEKMLEEIGRCFRPEPQEELLSTVQALFQKCFRLPITDDDAIPEGLTENVRRVCSKFFMQSMHSSKPLLRQFVDRYRSRFLNDFLPSEEGGNYPTTLTRLMRRLKWWKSYLRHMVAQSHRDVGSRQLSRLSPYLSRFEARSIEIPGQYGRGYEPRSGSHIILERFSHVVSIVRHNGMSFRRIGFVGSDGSVTHFLVQFFVSHITKSDERMMQLTRILNMLMMKSRETRERGITFLVPAVVPLTNRLRLFESDPSIASMDSVLEHMCSFRNIDADDALTVYRNQLGAIPEDQREGPRNEIQRLIVSEHVPSNTLQQYLERSLVSHGSIWAFKLEMAKQLGLTSFMSFALRIGDRTPHKIWFSRQSARIVQTDFYPSYSSTHVIDHSEAVPFRLTPNLVEFCTPFLIEGVFGSSFISSAACWLRRQHILKNYLNLFLRDDLLSWSVTLNPISCDGALDELEKQLRPMVSSNTSQILSRVQSLMPSSPSAAEAAQLPSQINAKVQRLIETATNIDNLSAMPPTWYPWF